MIEKNEKTKNIDLLSRLLRRLCRTLAMHTFPNCLRIFFLRRSGIKINRDVIINEGFTLACDVGYEENLVIEDRVAIGPNVTIIITSNPNLSELGKLKDNYPFIDVRGKVYIKHDAWIGACSTILPNITIGEFSIIGSGSVVTKEVIPGTIVAGVPAKIIKKLDFISNR